MSLKLSKDLHGLQDILRGQYQQLSADPDSLANLDQGMYALCLVFYWSKIYNSLCQIYQIIFREKFQ